MFLSRTFRSWKPQSLCFHFQLARVHSNAVAQKKDHQWHPFSDRNSPAAQEYDAQYIAMQKKRKLEGERRFRPRKTIASHLPKEGSNEEVLAFEVQDLLSELSLESTNDISRDDAQPDDSETAAPKSKAERSSVKMFTELEVEIVSMSSTGDGLAYSPSKDQVIAIPFTTPGDIVKVRPYRESGLTIFADFLSVVQPSSKREGITPKCQYFGKCSGCQLQMISYEEQLKHKKTIVEKAFKHFSGLSTDKIPPVADTMGSPLKYEYRTKLTPHFSVPMSFQKSGKRYDAAPPIGFNRKGKLEKGEESVLDIEHCPIGTPILQEGLTIERARVNENIKSFKRGKTILLRESTKRIPTSGLPDQDGTTSSTLDFDSAPTSKELLTNSAGKPELKITYPTHTELKTYITVEDATSIEYIGPYKFVNRAGSFFQNNNSILRPFTEYIYENYKPKTTPSSTTATPAPKIKYLLDAYCGSGLFTITLSPLFSSALGIDVDREGIKAARLNAENNSIHNAGFIEADASDLFADVPFPPDESLVIIDPPRKGASKDFLQQLCNFRAKRVVYVSCNVHTQARDVGMIVNGFKDGCRYEIESLRGFDFFPQTGHVEGVCILNRVDE